MNVSKKTTTAISEWCVRHAPTCTFQQMLDLVGIVESEVADALSTEAVRTAVVTTIPAKKEAPSPKETPKEEAPKKKKKNRLLGTTGKEVPGIVKEDLIPLLSDLYNGHYFIHGPTGHIVTTRTCPANGRRYYALMQPRTHSPKLGPVTKKKLRDPKECLDVTLNPDWRYSLGGGTVSKTPGHYILRDLLETEGLSL